MKKAFVATLPVLAGYLVLGSAYGVLMSASGFSPWYTALMSLFVYAGSLQFAAIGLLTGGASLLSAGLTAFSVNARHVFYGLSMAERYRGAGRIKPYLIFALTDETYALVSRAHPGLSPAEELRLCLRVSLLDHIYWVSGSLLGALAGSLLSLNVQGLDFALTALFLTVFIDQWRDGEKQHAAALTGAGLTLACLLLFGKDSFLIPALGLILAALLLFPKETGEGKQ